MTREDNQMQWAMLLAPALERMASGTGPDEGWRLWGAFPNTLTIHELALQLASIVEQHSNGRITELEAENRHLANNLDVARMGRETAEATTARVEALPVHHAYEVATATFNESGPVIWESDLKAALKGKLE